MNKDIEIGSLVEALKGRDKTTIYLVLDITSKNEVVLVNGDNKTFEKPKTKNIKHVKNLNHVVSHLKEKILSKKSIYDAEVYSCIKKYKEN